MWAGDVGAHDGGHRIEQRSVYWTKEPNVNTAMIHPRRRAVWQALNLLVAGVALAVGVVAITTDDVASSQKPVPATAPKGLAPGVCAPRVPSAHC
jgi:hypothetical protein